MRVIDPWEVHCIECGEPDCYRSCAKYRFARTGRCGRGVVSGWWLVVSGKKTVRFLEWGKLELLWHGGMASEWVAAVARALTGLFEPLALAFGPRIYRVFRSVRWRVGKALAWHKTQPTLWRVSVECERNEKLRLILRDKALNVVGEWTFCAEGRRSRSTVEEIEISLPRIEEGALFSIYPEGATASGSIRFLKNELLADPICPLALIANSQQLTTNIKCIAWDLDGVIWDGTLSEGEDVKLRPGVMETIKALDEAGIVSSICSKNDADVALAKLKELGIEEWFVFPQINWGPKSESLKNLAKEMNIGLDSIAFVDDRDENRTEVNANCPGVRVLDENECFEFSRVEVEKCRKNGEKGLGRERRLKYREEMERRGAAKEFAGDSAAFAAASGLSFELLPVEGECIERCRELVQRTNQLNLTARRYDEATFAELLAKNECVAVRVWDKYGDYGIVGFIAKKGTHLVECCFSCRSAGRGIERKVLAQIAGGRKLTADIVAAERNAPIREIIKEFL